MRFLKTILICGIALVWPVSIAQSQLPACIDRADMVKGLARDYEERLAAQGKMEDEDTVIVEILVSESGTWSILLTNTQNMSCLVYYGEGWDFIRPLVEEAGVVH